jgi:BMFP domain-containing protein YqiC
VLSGLRDEAEGMLRQRLERILADMNVVPREEFEAVRDMAANARREQELLSARVTALEAALATQTRDDKSAANESRTGDAASEPASKG